MQFSFAQEKTVTGVVSDDFGTLPGATVQIRGTNKGVTSDFDGNYSIQAKQGDVLEISFTGKKKASITVGAGSVYNVTLQNDLVGVEIVVTGYGTSTKAKTTVAAVTVGNELIQNRPNVNVLNSLQGQVAGLNIATSSGQPGTNKNDVIIRGSGAISSSSDPLYVIDGVPLNSAFFRSLNPNEIESVTVLKDAAGTSVYGNRGSNGVIVITTKKGQYKKSFSANYSSSYGLTTFQGDGFNLPTAVEHLKLQRKGFDEGATGLNGSLAVTGSYLGGAVTANPNNLDAFGIDTNWQDIFIRTGKTSSHDLNFTSGGENTRNFTALGYFEQDGILPTTNFKRFTLRNNFSGKSINEKFNYAANIFGAFSRRNQFESETRQGISSNVLQNPLTGYINSPRFVPSSLYQNGAQLLADFGNPALNLTPLMLLDLFQPNAAPSFFNEIKVIGTFNLGYKITKDLTFSTTTGIDFADDKRNFAIGPEAYLSRVRAAGANQPFNGIETMSSTSEFMFNHVNKLAYNKTIKEDHTIDVAAYTEYMKAHRRFNSFTQTGLDPLTWSPGAGTGYVLFNPATQPLSYRPSVGAQKIDAGLLSVFGTFDYDYKSKYGFSSSVRRDGSYRFVDDNQWGTFWSVAGRWNITKEDFFAKSDMINLLKLRASYGTTGNQNVLARGLDANNSTIFGGSQLVRDLNSSVNGYNNTQAFGVSAYANRDLRWEETTQFNVGLDFELLRTRLTGAVDYYNRLTDGIYQQTPISAANGITALASNDGAIRNQGVELELRYKVLKDTKFKLAVFANGAYNKNTIENIGSIDTDGDGVFRPSDSFTRNQGELFGQYFLVPYVGVNPATGNLLFLDINGNYTESPTDVDRRSTGKASAPIFLGGFGFEANYGGFFVNTLFTYAAKIYAFDFDYSGLMDIRNAGQFPVSTDLFSAWTPSNTNSNVPALGNNNYDLGDLSDRFLRDASYIRMRNLTVGYTVPQKFLDRTFIKGLNFRIMAENYLTLTNWKGFDPELLNSTAGNQNAYPTPKIITFGLDASF
jgi:TonB-linked SusC/RagA family outer membrane protein